MGSRHFARPRNPEPVEDEPLPRYFCHVWGNSSHGWTAKVDHATVTGDGAVCTDPYGLVVTSDGRKADLVRELYTAIAASRGDTFRDFRVTLVPGPGVPPTPNA